LADQGLAAVHYARSRPVLMGVVAALLVMRNRGVVGMVSGAWGLWKAYHSVAKKQSSRCE
jgi:putative Ca2+/H+ antiporter (TMEM165/GDT1 family)